MTTKHEDSVNPKPDVDAATRVAIMIRPKFLAKLTLKRLRDADVKL